MKLNTLWVPTDFSDCATGALTYAAAMAKAGGAGLHLVHSYLRPLTAYPAYDSVVALVDPALEREVRQALQKRLQAIVDREPLKNLKATYELVADTSIWQHAKKVKPGAKTHGAELIVMGTTGHTGLLHGGLFGTNTERTLRLANVPVLVVPHGVRFKAPKVVLFPTDFGPEMKKSFIHVRDFAKLWDAKLVVATINTPEAYNTNKHAEARFALLKRIAPYKQTELAIYNAPTVTEGIMTLAYMHKADVIAMFTHGRTGLRHLLSGSIAEMTGANVKLPMLVIKNGRD
jgi:nucleotide-binding universal stress UspA family protein